MTFPYERRKDVLVRASLDIGQIVPVRKRIKKRDYYAYIRSEAWQEKRRLFYRKSKRVGRCAACLATDKPLDLHHKTYKRLGIERLGDLELLCRDCHKLVHERHKQAPEKGIWRATHKFIHRTKKAALKERSAPSKQEIMAGQSKRFGWTKETLESWGVSWPPRKGWKRRLIRKHKHQQRMRDSGLHVHSARPETKPVAEVRDDS